MYSAKLQQKKTKKDKKSYEKDYLKNNKKC